MTAVDKHLIPEVIQAAHELRFHLFNCVVRRGLKPRSWKAKKLKQIRPIAVDVMPPMWLTYVGLWRNWRVEIRSLADPYRTWYLRLDEFMPAESLDKKFRKSFQPIHPKLVVRSVVFQRLPDHR